MQTAHAIWDEGQKYCTVSLFSLGSLYLHSSQTLCSVLFLASLSSSLTITRF